MSFFSGFAIYFIIWWLTLFVVLPLGVRSQAEDGHVEPGTDPGAPAKPNLGRKLILNTILAGVVFGVWYYLTKVAGLDLTELSTRIFSR